MTALEAVLSVEEPEAYTEIIVWLLRHGAQMPCAVDELQTNHRFTPELLQTIRAELQRRQ